MWSYNYAPDTNELYHWGIKGMRWGVRRYQNKDGSLTPAGKKRYGDGETSEPKKSKHRLALEAKFKSAGMSDSEAAKQADKRIRTEKILAAVGVTTVAAATTYVVHKHLKEKSDSLIKAGDSLSRVEMTGDGKLHDVFYAAKDKSDKTKYAGMLGMTRRQQVGKAYMMDIGVQKDIKVAGKDKSLSIFKKLVESDPDFAEGMTATNVHGRNAAKGNIKKMYDNFNSRIVFNKSDPSVNKFFDALKSEGYGAVRDINDSKFSGYHAKNPLIVFGQSSNVTVKTVKELSKNEVAKNLVKDGAREMTTILAQQAAVAVPVSSLLLYSDAYQPAATVAKTTTKSIGRKK